MNINHLQPFFICDITIMELEFLGLKFRLEVVVICVLLGYLIGGFALCSCSKITHVQEGFNNPAAAGLHNAAEIDSSVDQQDWASDAAAYQKQSGADNIFKSNAGISAGQVPLPADQLFLFYDNQFKSECCPNGNGYSSSGGCACMSVKQLEYLNARGGNRSASTIY